MRGLPADLVTKSQAREMKDLDDMNVLEWVEESTVPKDAQILDYGWAMKMTSPSGVRARVVLKIYAVTKLDDLHAPTPTSMTVRCLLLHAAWFGGGGGVGSQHIRCESSVPACSCFRPQVCETSC